MMTILDHDELASAAPYPPADATIPELRAWLAAIYDDAAALCARYSMLAARLPDEWWQREVFTRLVATIASWRRDLDELGRGFGGRDLGELEAAFAHALYSEFHRLLQDEMEGRTSGGFSATGERAAFTAWLAQISDPTNPWRRRR